MTTFSPGRSSIPEHVPQDRVREWSYIEDPDFAAHPYETYAELRDIEVFYSPLHGGYWVPTSMSSLRAVLQDAETFSNTPVTIPEKKVWPRKMIPKELDPPEHGKYRKHLLAMFSPKSVAAVEAQIQEETNALIDSLEAKGSCDLVRDFCVPLPTRMFLRIVGLPLDMAGTFRQWASDMIHSSDPEVSRAAGVALLQYMSDYIAGLAADKSATGPLVDLLRAEIDGRPITETEVIDTAYALFLAGLDTVASSLGWMFRYLVGEPENRKRLHDDPGVARDAVEELLRAFSIVNSSRRVTRETTVGGVTMMPGDRVLAAYGFANLDPEAFDDPRTVDFDRSNKVHYSFGLGPHRCIGSHLARAELRIALTEWHRRIPDYAMQSGTDAVHRVGSVVGVNSLPIRWDG